VYNYKQAKQKLEMIENIMLVDACGDKKNHVEKFMKSGSPPRTRQLIMLKFIERIENEK
jgi:hypothetical protein